MRAPQRRQLVYAALAAATMLLGLASRRYPAMLPAFAGEYSGDTLWALMLYLLISIVLFQRTPLQRAAVALILAYGVELSQLYHAPWIDSLRQTRVGGLVLGFGFLWSDLICYSVGIAIGACVERAVTRSWQERQAP